MDGRRATERTALGRWAKRRAAEGGAISALGVCYAPYLTGLHAEEQIEKHQSALSIYAQGSRIISTATLVTEFKP